MRRFDRLTHEFDFNKIGEFRKKGNRIDYDLEPYYQTLSGKYISPLYVSVKQVEFK